MNYRAGFVTDPSAQRTRRGCACALLVGLLSFCRQTPGCTIFIAPAGKHILVGNNEDYVPGTRTFLWFRPGVGARLGYVSWGFKEKYPEGGLNEKGLFFDAAALPRAIPIVKKPGRADFEGYLVEPLLKRCSTVAEAVRFIERYNLVWQEKAQIFLADRSGATAVVHANYILWKRAPGTFALTNYSLQNPATDRMVCWRRRAAQRGLASAGPATLGRITSVLRDTAQADLGNATLYSQAIDLTEGRVTLYHLRNFDQPCTFRLRDALARGPRDVEMRSLFPPTVRVLVEKRGLAATLKQLRRTGEIRPHELAEFGYTLLNQKRTVDALHVFRRALVLFPSAKAESDLANALAFAGRSGEADALRRRALKADPEDYCANLMHAADGVVRFKLKAFVDARKVGIAGDFNRYDPEALLLKKQGDAWVGEIRLPKGRHFYKVFVDGTWNTDPRNGMAGKPGEWWESLLIVP